MSIRDQGYQRYQGTRTPDAQRWMVVLRQTMRSTAKQPWVLAILIISIIPTLIAGVVMYFKMKIWAALPQDQMEQFTAQGLLSDPGLLVYSFQVSWYGTPILSFLMALFAGGGAIADDIRQNAFQFYFARPLSREQYVLGKTLAVTFLVWMVSLLPALLLAIVRVSMMRQGIDHVGVLALLPVRAILLSSLTAVALAVPAVALSSLSPRRGLVQGGFAALFLLPWILGAIVGSIMRSAWPSILSIPSLLEAVGARLFAYNFPADERALPWLPSLVVLVVCVAGAMALLRWRLSSVEVVSG